MNGHGMLLDIPNLTRLKIHSRTLCRDSRSSQPYNACYLDGVTWRKSDARY
jgi:hypothetical protein